MDTGLVHADVTVRVVEILKGNLTCEIRVIDLDLGDSSLQASPYRALPTELIGRRLLLLLTARKGEHDYRGYMRCLVEGDKVCDWAFGISRRDSRSLQDVRAMVAQLNLIQAACPNDDNMVTNQDAALAGCRTALRSQYDEVVWYGLRRLMDRDIPASFVPDLLSVLKSQEGLFPNGYLVVQCLGKTNQESAVPGLIDVLRRTPRTINDGYTVKALQAITGEEFGVNIASWENWWANHSQAEK
jgi:hypothetical protein